MKFRRRRGRTNWHKIAYPVLRLPRRRADTISRYLPNRREVRQAVGLAVVLAAIGWWLWDRADVAPSLLASPASWSIWDAGPGASAASPDTLAGRASVIDGDTIEIHGERIRILDIDAPESRQSCTAADGSKWRCGQETSLALANWVGSRTVNCESAGKDRYGRWLARCSVGGQNIAEWLARNGLAVPYRDCKCEAVRDAAAHAQAAGKGIWAGEFQMPWDWRKAH